MDRELDIDCAACGYPNSPSASFCGNCASALSDSAACPACGHGNPVGQRFCNACAHALIAPSQAAALPQAPRHLAEKIRAGRRALENERKQVTVLFADVIGSMALAEQCDPEDWRAVMERFFAILCEGVHRFEGTVDKFTGDGIMALFGAPVAHEDHARRACYAALHLQSELAAFSADLRRSQGISLAVRMGLNSGEVVVGAIGDDLSMAYTAVGHTVGLAQRMEQLAEPGSAYVTKYTASLVRGHFALTDLGEFDVNGVSRALQVFELAGVGAAGGPLAVSRMRGFSRFVGRDGELQVLETALEHALDGRGQVIGIVGEAGVGKSRLCHEFAERRRAEGAPVYHVAGQAHARSVPLVPVLRFLRAYFEIGEHDSDVTARERIAGKLLGLDASFDDDLPLLFEFHAVPDPDRAAARMDPEARQRRLLGLMKRMTHARSVREPNVFVFEDLHWLDPVSEMFLANQVEAVQGTRSLVILNFRPEYRAAWMSRSYYRQVALAPLGAKGSEALVRDLLGADASLDSLPERIRDRTQGNPFFIEELVQGLVEAGTIEGGRGAYRLVTPVAEAAVPATVQAVLAARIDRLDQDAKTVLQAAAVIGKEFPGPVLERVVELDPGRLEEALRNLVAGEFAYEHELYPEAVYTFKHPLTQEVAYGSQLSGRRAAVHAAVAQAIAEQYPERLDERAALVAQHWEAAGETLEAARWHARAGAWAGTGDPTQALRHWRKVCALADTLPESAETTELGLAARFHWLQYGFRIGISHEEAEAVFDEAQRIAVNAGNVRAQAELLVTYATVRGLNDGDMHEYARLFRQALPLAVESGDPELYVAVSPSSHSLFLIGELRECVAVLDRAIELADGDPTVGVDTTLGCPYAFCHTLKGLVQANRGELEQSRRLIEEGRRIAGEYGDVEVVGWNHMFAVWLAYFTGEPETAFGHARQQLEIAERIGASFSLAWAWLHVGFAERQRAHWRPAIEAIERSRAISRERRTAVEADAWRLAELAQAYLGAGDVERARELVSERRELAQPRPRGPFEICARVGFARVLLGSAGTSARVEIEAELSGALELARDTGAKAFEPLIHVELAELAGQCGEGERHQRELREAHCLFTEIGAYARAARLELESPTIVI